MGLGLRSLVKRARTVSYGTLRGSIILQKFIRQKWRTIVAVPLAAFGAASIADYLQITIVNIAVSAHTGYGQYSVASPVFFGVTALLSACIIWKGKLQALSVEAGPSIIPLGNSGSSVDGWEPRDSMMPSPPAER